MVEQKLSLEEHFIQAVRLKADELREDAIKQATARFESDLRSAVGHAAVSLSNFYSVSRLGPDLQITVRIGEAK